MPDLPDPGTRPGTSGSWNVVREVVVGGGVWLREIWLVDLGRERAIDYAADLQAQVLDTAPDGVRFVVESSDGLTRISVR